MQLEINRQTYQVPDIPDRSLLWVIRDELGLKGTKFSCEIGICGNCTILMDGSPARACITPLSAAEGREILTIEGLSQAGGRSPALHPVQEAFLEEQAPQCGWCQPAQILTAAALLDANPNPDDAEIQQAMNAIYCRCGTYGRIRQAVARAAAAGKEPARNA